MKNGKVLAFRILTNGSSAPASWSGVGLASVALTATGRLTLTLEKGYNACWAALATMQVAGNTTDLHAQVGTIANLGTATATTVVVRMLTATTETNLAANANNAVSVLLVMEDSAA
jgi:hypothetical protein